MIIDPLAVADSLSFMSPMAILIGDSGFFVLRIVVSFQKGYQLFQTILLSATQKVPSTEASGCLLTIGSLFPVVI
jgi:hypothetical protein